MALIDSHYIPVVGLTLYFLRSETITDIDKIILHNYIAEIFNELASVRIKHSRWPELNNNIKQLIEFVASKKRPLNFVDSSSVLIPSLLELLILLDGGEFYESIKENFVGNHAVNLQIAYPNIDELGDKVEEMFFAGSMYDHTYVEIGLQLPDSAAEFRESIVAQDLIQVPFITDAIGMPFLRTLACQYYRNDYFPWQWRCYFQIDQNLS